MELPKVLSIATRGGMARVGPTLDLGALTLAAFAAPGLSVVANLLIALTGAAFSGGADLARGVVGAFGMLMMAIVLVTLWGVLPAMAFGAGGAALSARVPASLAKWIGVWGLCGAVTAGFYVLISLGLNALSPSLAFWIAPWTIMKSAEAEQGGLGPALAAPIAGIVIAGACAGMIYRWRMQRPRIIYRTCGPIGGDPLP